MKTKTINKLFFSLVQYDLVEYVHKQVWFIQGQGQYTKAIKNVEEDIQSIIKRVNELAGIKESDTGLAPPALWDLAADKQNLANEQPLQVTTFTFF